MTTPDLSSFFDAESNDASEDWRNKPKSPPRVISSLEYQTLREISLEARDLWTELRTLEERAYAITQEADKTGYTSDLVLQSDVDIDNILQLLEITIEEAKP